MEAEIREREEAERLRREAERKEEEERVAAERVARTAREEAEIRARETEAQTEAQKEEERRVKEKAEREEAERVARTAIEKAEREEAERRTREEAEKILREAERVAREEAERRTREEAERRAREEAERRAEVERRAEADRRAAREERRTKEEAERRVKEEAERKEKEEAERKEKEKEESERRKEAEAEAERVAREAAERRVKEEEERVAAKRVAREEAERKEKKKEKEVLHKILKKPDDGKLDYIPIENQMPQLDYNKLRIIEIEKERTIHFKQELAENDYFIIKCNRDIYCIFCQYTDEGLIERKTCVPNICELQSKFSMHCNNPGKYLFSLHNANTTTTLPVEILMIRPINITLDRDIREALSENESKYYVLDFSAPMLLIFDTTKISNIEIDIFDDVLLTNRIWHITSVSKYHFYFTQTLYIVIKTTHPAQTTTRNCTFKIKTVVDKIETHREEMLRLESALAVINGEEREIIARMNETEKSEKELSKAQIASAFMQPLYTTLETIKAEYVAKIKERDDAMGKKKSKESEVMNFYKPFIISIEKHFEEIFASGQEDTSVLDINNMLGFLRIVKEAKLSEIIGVINSSESTKRILETIRKKTEAELSEIIGVINESIKRILKTIRETKQSELPQAPVPVTRPALVPIAGPTIEPINRCVESSNKPEYKTYSVFEIKKPNSYKSHNITPSTQPPIFTPPKLFNGIYNVGDTCYINALTQCLVSIALYISDISNIFASPFVITEYELMTKPLIEADDVNKIISYLCFLSYFSSRATAASISREPIISRQDTSEIMGSTIFNSGKTDRGGTDWKIGTQHPVDEAFTLFISNLYVQCTSNTFIYNSYNKFLAHFMYLRTTINFCVTTKRYSTIHVIEPLLNIQMYDGSESLIDNLNKYFATENVEWKCHICASGKCISFCRTIISTPKVLLIYLSRFDNYQNKIDKECIIPLQFSLNGENYDLISFAFHMGPTRNGGHWMSYTRLDNAKWRKYDDRTIEDHGVAEMTRAMNKGSFYVYLRRG